MSPDKEDVECDEEPSDELCEKCANAPVCIKRIDCILEDTVEPISREIALRTVRMIRQATGDDEALIRRTLRTVSMCLIDLERDYTKFAREREIKRQAAEN